MSFDVTEYDVDGLDDEALAPILETVNLLSHEAEPRAVDLTLDEFRARSNSPGMVQRRFVARSVDGEVVGTASGRYPDDGTNSDLLMCRISVVPDARRKEAGSQLLEALVTMAEDLGRSRLQSFFFDTVPEGKAFAQTVGAKENLDFHENMLRIADLDVSLMTEWAGLGDSRAPGYVLHTFVGDIPGKWHADIAHLFFVLERDMPMADDFEPRVWDAKRYAELHAHFLKGSDVLSVLAIHADSGTGVGMTQMMRRHNDPASWVVTVTMVDPEHRGRSLGKWLKGTANLEALERWEGGLYQTTGNAFTNEPMLAINHAMGFQHEFTVTDCSIDVVDARSYLRSRQKS